MASSKIYKILICIVVCMAFGFASGLSSGDSIRDWYANLNKPFFNPPNWIFGPVWTVLYIMMGIAVGRVWHHISVEGVSFSPVYLFIVQFILNLAWTFLFFVLQSPILGLIDIILLWLLLLATIVSFRKIDKLSSNLLIPYLLWVSFATLLNASILYLN